MPLLRFKTDTARKSFRVEYPFESNCFSLPALRMHYLDEGDGPPKVMVHGNPTWSYYRRNKDFPSRTTALSISSPVTTRGIFMLKNPIFAVTSNFEPS